MFLHEKISKHVVVVLFCSLNLQSCFMFLCFQAAALSKWTVTELYTTCSQVFVDLSNQKQPSCFKQL